MFFSVCNIIITTSLLQENFNFLGFMIFRLPVGFADMYRTLLPTGDSKSLVECVKPNEH